MMLYFKQNGELQKEGYVAVTDDLKHDTHAVAQFETSAIKHVRDKGVEVNKVHQWTDGCAAQYKGRHSFAEISLAETKNNVTVVRNIYETSHGKGPCDGLGDKIKKKVSNAVLQNNNISVSSASDLLRFCEENLSNVGESTYNSRRSRYTASSRTFKLFEKIDRSATTSVKTLNGTRMIHCASSTGMGFQLKVRHISCYCKGCQDNTECSNKEYVDAWETKVLKPVDVPSSHDKPPETILPPDHPQEVPVLPNDPQETP